jgi:uncharacterized membrane protein
MYLAETGFQAAVRGVFYGVAALVVLLIVYLLVTVPTNREK